MKSIQICIHCSTEMPKQDSLPNEKELGVILCDFCHNKYSSQLKKSTPIANKLFFSLRARNIDAKLAYYDGNKTVDIYIPESKLFIEVDGIQHNTDSKQALSDLMRTYYAIREGYFTLRIPNSLVKLKLHQTITFIIYINDLRKESLIVSKAKRA